MYLDLNDNVVNTVVDNNAFSSYVFLHMYISHFVYQKMFNVTVEWILTVINSLPEIYFHTVKR